MYEMPGRPRKFHENVELRACLNPTLRSISVPDWTSGRENETRVTL